MATNGARASTPAPAAALKGSDPQPSTSIKRKAEDDAPPARGITKPLSSPAPIFGSAVFGAPNGATPLATPNGTSFASLADHAKNQE
ncbi:hypothetical protein EJ03DRAFT_348438 [Teratosphaeria nubilosa]|uniref:Uncharacterized protein n=1 Tax=Teratosphaeria nubilosa TaxID=161662 RepID=A0A6G1LHT8_9PEZI|nr:hypothetical protein EJ03DRAFT_348438 [Teratosphaeria nubilosa]